MRFRSNRRPNSPSRTPNDIVKRIVEVRNTTDFDSEQLVNIVNESMNLEGRGDFLFGMKTKTKEKSISIVNNTIL